MSTVYVFGAGASAADKAPTIKNFLGLSYEYFKDDATHKPVWKFLFDYYNRDPRNIREFNDELPQIDEVISTLDWALSNNIALLPDIDLNYIMKIKKSLILLMSKTLERALIGNNTDTNHDLFINNLSDTEQRSGFDIISLNYDMLLDNAISRRITKLPHYGLSKKRPISGYRLYKLHGSLNWAVCPFCQRIKTYNDKIAHTLFGISDKCTGCSGRNMEPVLISPTLLKSYNIPELHKIWSEAFEAISTATKLVFIGYSLPPADFAIIELIKRAIHMKNKLEQVHVIDYNPEHKQGYRSEVELRYNKIFGKIVTFNMEGFSGELL